MIGTQKNMGLTMAVLAARFAAQGGGMSMPTFVPRHDHTNRWKNPFPRRSHNKYARKCRAMASKKPRHIHETEFMRAWKPRYPDGVKAY